MAKETIFIGSTPNDGTGDPIRSAFIKTNNNFTELYTTYATTAYVDNELASLIGTAPEALDTLGEIAAALAADDNTVNALIVTISTKANTTYVNDVFNSVNALSIIVNTKANTSNLSNVAFSGSYNDLSNTPVLITGFTGSQGSTGFTGSQGTQGTNGFTGSLGFTGSQGSGFTGSQGTTGFTGSLGTTGFTGSRGFTGSIGLTGSTGISTNTTIATAIGSPSDEQFDLAVDNVYVYYCTANYDGTSNVWKRIAFSANTW